MTEVGAGYGQSIGVRPGDFIRAVNGQTISSTGQLQGVLSAPTASWALSIERGGQMITARFST